MVEVVTGYIKYRKAKFYFDKGNYKKALPLFNTILEDNTDRVDAHINVAATLLRMDRYNEAVIVLNKGLKLDKNDPVLNEYLFYVHDITENNAEALKAVDRLIEIEDNNYIHFLRKAALYGKSNPDMCLKYSYEAVNKFPEVPELYTQLGLAYSFNNNYENALGYYQKALDLGCTSTVTLNNYGYELSRVSRYDEAISYFDQCITAEPDFAFPYNNRGLCHLKKGDTFKALEDINYSLELNPENSYAYKNRALYYIEIKDFEKAFQDLKTARYLGFEYDYGNEVNDLIGRLLKENL